MSEKFAVLSVHCHWCLNPVHCTENYSCYLLANSDKILLIIKTRFVLYYFYLCMFVVIVINCVVCSGGKS